MQIPASLGNKDIHDSADVATEYMELVSCPDCSMIAAVQGDGCLDSTDGPVDHVRVTCINRHWFLMPADTFADCSRTG